MWNPDVTFAGAIKIFGVMGLGAVTVSGWLWTGAAWKTEVDIKLDNLATNNIKLEERVERGFDKIERNFDKVDKKIDRNFDLLIAEIRNLKK